jgi:hypothetical protein
MVSYKEVEVKKLLVVAGMVVSLLLGVAWGSNSAIPGVTFATATPLVSSAQVELQNQVARDHLKIEALEKRVKQLKHRAFTLWIRLHVPPVPGDLTPNPGSSSGSSEATARCEDGTLSYSQTASGTCSWHGGVDYWINYP